MFDPVPPPHPALFAGLAAVAAGLADCAATTRPKTDQDPVGVALARPVRDLSLIRRDAPAELAAP